MKQKRIPNDDTHNLIIKACMQYIKWQTRFEYDLSVDAGKKSRFWLSEMRRLAKIRRKEIQDKRAILKDKREHSGPGRPRLDDLEKIRKENPDLNPRAVALDNYTYNKKD